MAALQGYKADLYMASGAPVSFTQEAMTDSGDHQTYKITDAAKRYWDDTGSAPTVEVSTDGGTTWAAATAGTYSVQYVGGVVTFTSADGSRSVRVSGNYLAISQVGQAHAWEVNPSANVMDVTTFGNAWKQKLVGLKDATAKASRYYVDGTFLGLLGSRFVMIFYTNYASDLRFEAYARLKTAPAKVSVDATVDEDLEWEISGQLYAVLS